MRYLVATLALLTACNSAAGPTVSPRFAIAIADGDAQTATVAKALPTAVTAQVKDSVTLAPKSGVLVNWIVVTGGGSVFAGNGLTDANGLARERWTLGTAAGTQVLEARAVDQAGNPIVFARATATALPDIATKFVLPGALDTSLARSQLIGDQYLILEYAYQDKYGNSTWNCANASAPLLWPWQLVDMGVVGRGAAPNPPLLVVLDTVIVRGNHSFVMLNLRAAQQPADWSGTQVSVSTSGCAALSDSVYIHYDNLR